jgi:hypothetical protein
MKKLFLVENVTFASMMRQKTHVLVAGVHLHEIKETNIMIAPELLVIEKFHPLGGVIMTILRILILLRVVRVMIIMIDMIGMIVMIVTDRGAMIIGAGILLRHDGDIRTEIVVRMMILPID